MSFFFLSCLCIVVDMLGIRGALAVGHSLGAFSIACAAALDARKQSSLGTEIKRETLFSGEGDQKKKN